MSVSRGTCHHCNESPCVSRSAVGIGCHALYMREWRKRERAKIKRWKRDHFSFQKTMGRIRRAVERST